MVLLVPTLPLELLELVEQLLVEKDTGVWPAVIPCILGLDNPLFKASAYVLGEGIEANGTSHEDDERCNPEPHGRDVELEDVEATLLAGVDLAAARLLVFLLAVASSHFGMSMKTDTTGSANLTLLDVFIDIALVVSARRKMRFLKYSFP